MTGRRGVGWTRLAPLLASGALVACQTPPPTAPPPPTQAEIVREQLANILAAQVPDCGTVSLYNRRERFDYLVQCDSGRAYRVRLGAAGQVLVTPAPPP